MTNTKLVLTILAASVMLLWLTLAVRGPRKINTPNSITVLRYGSLLRIFALIFALAPPTLLICMVWVFLWRSDTILALAGGSFLTASLIAGLLLIEVERVQIVLTDEGITRYSPWRGITTLRWSNIERIRYSAANRWFLIDGTNQTIRVSRHLVGAEKFAEAVRTRVAPERWVSAAVVLNAM